MKNMPTKITNKKSYKYFVTCDDVARNKNQKFLLPIRDTAQRFQHILRKTELLWNTKKRSPLHLILGVLAKIRYTILCRFYNVEIPLNVFGPGLIIWHLQGITINGFAKVGRNFSLSKGCTIGHKNWIIPKIGDNCEMMINSSILGKGINAHNVSLGAHALVVKEIDESNSIWVGIPAKEINSKPAKDTLERIKRVDSIPYN